MLEVSAKLKKSSVYLAGETVECILTFSYPKKPAHKVSQSHDDAFGSLAWASAQILCQCTTSSQVRKQDESPENITYSETALPTGSHDHGFEEISTKPKIIFCDMQLCPGQVKTYIYQEKIPNDAPPSYRGQLVKYSYKITIGMQQINSPIQLLKVPIRVLPVNFALESEGVFHDTIDELTPSNPFVETCVGKRETPFDLCMQSLQNITSRRHPNFFLISNTWGKVARFCLFKPAYRLGEDIIGTFDFTAATVNCVQVSVSLQSEEETTIQGTPNIKKTRVITFTKQHEVCLGLQYSQLVLPIPLYVTPAFSTKLVTLNWRLHFEFVTSSNREGTGPKFNETEWKASPELQVETMVWSLPIKLYSTTPSQVTQGFQSNIYKITVR